METETLEKLIVPFAVVCAAAVASVTAYIVGDTKGWKKRNMIITGILLFGLLTWIFLYIKGIIVN